MAQNLILGSSNTDKIYVMDGLTSSIDDSFSLPTATMTDMTVSPADGDLIYLEDSGDAVVHMDGLSSTFSSSYGLPSFHMQPSGITFDSSGNLVHIGYYKDKLFLHSGESATITASYSVSDSAPKGLGCDSDGNILYGGDSNNDIYKMDGVSSSVLDTISAPDNGVRGAVWDFDNDDLIFMNEDMFSPYTDSRVYIFEGFSTTIKSSYLHPDQVTPRGLCYPTYIVSGGGSGGAPLINGRSPLLIGGILAA